MNERVDPEMARATMEGLGQTAGGADGHLLPQRGRGSFWQDRVLGRAGPESFDRAAGAGATDAGHQLPQRSGRRSGGSTGS